MKMVSALFPGTVTIDDTEVSTFVIENKALYLKVLKDLYLQCKGEPGEIILSENDETLKIANRVELITDFVILEPDSRKMLNRICRLMEEEALGCGNYSKTMGLISDIERFMDELSDSFSFPLIFEGININALIKMSAPKWADESNTAMEHIINYMELIRELLGEKLFVMVGMKNYFSDRDMQDFIYTAVAHKYHVLLLESFDNTRLDKEHILLIDNDICEI